MLLGKNEALKYKSQIFYFFLFCFLSYFMGELLMLSGFMTIFSFTFFFNQNTKPIYNKKSQIGINSIIKTSCFWFENFCFIFLGSQVFDILFNNLKFIQIFIAICVIFSLCLLRWFSIRQINQCAIFYWLVILSQINLSLRTILDLVCRTYQGKFIYRFVHFK